MRKALHNLSRRRFLKAGMGLAGWLKFKSSWATDELGTAPTNLDLESAFLNPPMSSRPWVYWWVAIKTGITADLEETKHQGLSGVIIFHAGAGGNLSP